MLISNIKSDIKSDLCHMTKDTFLITKYFGNVPKFGLYMSRPNTGKALK